jgi:exodeoxyribonuclease V beta subunit
VTARRPNPPLDPLTVPLGGLVAVEASAGTGKTFTITQLYVRLLLETGLGVEEILVVTYTKAATAELRGRLRDHLTTVRAALETGTSDDEFARRIVARTSDRPSAARAIERALFGFDEAAVFTIHGFCQRVLAEHAFESGILFETELVPDERALVQEVADDFWRRSLYDASPGFVRWVLEHPKLRPDSLAKLVRTYASREYRSIDAPDEPPTLAADEAELARLWAAARDRFEEDWPVVEKLLGDPDRLNRNSYRPDAIPSWGPVIGQTLASEVPDADFERPLECLRASKVRSATKKGKTPPTHPLFDAVEDLAVVAERVKKGYEARVSALQAAIVRDGREALQSRKGARRVQSYDDLVNGLASALADPDRGQALAARIRDRYRAALVDEFQDTDPVQYDIVKRVYGGTDLPVFVVGDPKQAIYGFRGADVFTYLAARDDARDDYPLDRNWRSTPELIRAVNALFGGVPSPFVVEGIPFIAARPGDRLPVPLVVDGDPEAPLRLWLADSDDMKGKEDQRDGIAAATAREVARLIALGSVDKATLGGESVHGGHIAILVRRNVEGRTMRERLLRLGVASVQQAVDSVYASREAMELERVLLAVAEPARGALVRAALATDLLGVPGEGILALDQDEDEWERRVEAFHDYKQTWLGKGFAAMLRELLRKEDVACRLLAFDDGERRLTNVLHLMELLEVEWLAAPGAVDALIEGLADARNAAEPDAEDQQLRLESDERLVKIVTVHKSKGLQYPIVFCPFLWDGKLRSPTSDAILVHEEGDDPRPTLDLGSTKREDRNPLAKREELAESVRLLYVAVTRAQQRCYLVWGRLKHAGTSPLAWLLHPAPAGSGDPIDAVEQRYKKLTRDGLEAELAPLVARAGGTILVEKAPTWTPLAAVRASDPAPHVGARRLTRTLEPSWEVTSFTGLVSRLDPERPDYDAARTTMTPPAPVVRTRDLFGFDRGARAGRCLHAILEHVDYAGDATGWAPVVRGALASNGFDLGWEPVLVDMVARVVATGLADGGDVRLERVAMADRANELEFHHPLRRLDGTALRRLLASHGFGTGPIREAVQRMRVQSTGGFMKGFIDLVCCCDGRYWLVDWKSNWLGDTLDDYAAERLLPTIATDHYWLQYLVYAVVVHRLLRRRLPGYDYDRHVGGVRYLFLRGMHPDRGTATGVYQDRPSRELVEALDAFMEPTT